MLSSFFSHAFSIPACLASLASGQEELTNQRFRFSLNFEPLTCERLQQFFIIDALSDITGYR